jgi:hypothetical protein
VNLAEDLNITVIGFARGDRLNIYSRPKRIKLPPLLWRDTSNREGDEALRQIHM